MKYVIELWEKLNANKTKLKLLKWWEFGNLNTIFCDIFLTFFLMICVGSAKKYLFMINYVSFCKY